MRGVAFFPCQRCLSKNGWYCWWLKSQTTTWDVWNPINNGKNYQPQLVQDFSHQQYLQHFNVDSLQHRWSFSQWCFYDFRCESTRFAKLEACFFLIFSEASPFCQRVKLLYLEKWMSNLMNIYQGVRNHQSVVAWMQRNKPVRYYSSNSKVSSGKGVKKGEHIMGWPMTQWLNGGRKHNRRVPTGGCFQK